MENLRIAIYDTVDECQELLNKLQERLGEPYGNFKVSNTLNKYGIVIKVDRFEDDFIEILGEVTYDSCPVLTRDNTDWFPDVK
jgi:hypothetical protein